MTETDIRERFIDTARTIGVEKRKRAGKIKQKHQTHEENY